MRIILFLLLLYPTVVQADPKINYLNTLVPNMIDFIRDKTEYKYNGDPYPEIFIVDEKSVCTGAYGKPVETCDIAGYYNDDTNEIYIREQPTQYMTDDRFMEVVLVHELVHFLQYHDGTYEKVECRQNLEMPAYEVQDAYIELHGIDDEQKADPLFALISSMCPNQHPLMFHHEQ